MAQITSSTRNRIRLITIDNQPKRNAITHAMAEQLLAEFKRAEADSAIRVVVVTGAGPLAFSSGHDLSEPLGDDVEREGEAAFGFPRRMRKPVIAAVSGHCHAAGIMLAVACDIRVADLSARFGSPGAKLGMLPVGGQIPRWPQYMSPGRAKLFMMTAETIDGAKAAEWGLVDLLESEGSALDAALRVADVIAGNSPAVVSAVKSGVSYWSGATDADVDAWEKTQSAQVKKAGDAPEGVKAFFEKRKPAFADLA